MPFCSPNLIGLGIFYYLVKNFKRYEDEGKNAFTNIVSDNYSHATTPKAFGFMAMSSALVLINSPKYLEEIYIN